MPVANQASQARGGHQTPARSPLEAGSVHEVVCIAQRVAGCARRVPLALGTELVVVGVKDMHARASRRATDTERRIELRAMSTTKCGNGAAAASSRAASVDACRRAADSDGPTAKLQTETVTIVKSECISRARSYVAFMPKAARSAQRPRLHRLHTVAPPHSQPWERKPSLSAAAAFGLRNVTYALSSGLQSGFTWAAQDCTTATRWLVAAWTVLSRGARATWPMCRNDDNSTLRGPSRL